MKIRINTIDLVKDKFTLKLKTNIGDIVILKARLYPKQDEIGASSKDGVIVVKGDEIYFEWEG